LVVTVAFLVVMFVTVAVVDLPTMLLVAAYIFCFAAATTGAASVIAR